MVAKVSLNSEWELGDPIGAGGFGRVFSAHSVSGDPAVIKFIPKQAGAERELLFSGEGVRNVVPIIDSGEYGADWVIVMPRADKSLREHLEDAGGALPVDEAVKILYDVAGALADLDGDVVHRDLKPENILLLHGVWSLADFGLARYASADTETHTWKFSGTLPYMAPERWRLERATIASDIYSLGVVAYEMLAGVLPFVGSDFRDLHLHAVAPRLVAAPHSLAALVEESLYKAPQARPTPENWLARLEKISEGSLKGGMSALAQANREVTSQRAESDRKVSREQTERERRGQLFEAAKMAMAGISELMSRSISGAAPSGDIRQAKEGGWIFHLGTATLGLSAAHEIPRSWKGSVPSTFDVIAHATISVRRKADHRGYQGRSHSLWYCDAQKADQYGWFETAFMTSPLMRAASSIEPFALSPDADAWAALRPAMDVRQVAWPFTPLQVNDLEAFIDRWADWLAKASNGQLSYPSRMPEHSPEGSWR